MTEVVTSRSERDPARAVVGRLPLVLVLGTIVTLATVLHAALALRSPSIWIVPDELIYSELAKSLGEGGLPKIRGEISFDYGIGYPLLLAPIWAALTDLETAYAVAKVMNALVLSLTSVPAYFLARRFVEQSGAILVAALTVSVPAMLYSGTLMTEVALYPLVVLALLAMATAIESPRRRAQLAVFAAIAVAVSVKAIAVVLVPSYVVGIVLFHWLETRERETLRGRLRLYTPSWLALGAAAVGAVGFAIADGGRPQDIFGSYASVIDHMEPLEVPGWILLHLAELDLYVAVIPLASSLVLLMRGVGRDASRAERLYLALAAPVLGAWLVAVGAFASVPFLESFGYPENVERLQGRSTFVLAPTLFVGLALWLQERHRAPMKVIPVAALCAFLPVVIPIDELDGNVRFQAVSLVPWVALADTTEWPIEMLVFTVALGAVFVLGARFHLSAPALVAPIVLAYVVVGIAAHGSMQRASEWTRSAAWGTVDPDWLDAEIGSGGEVSVLWSELPGRPFVDLAARHRILFVGEFFNRSVGTVYEIGSPLPYALPSTPVRLDAGRVMLENGRPANLGDHVLAPCHVHVAGDIISRDPVTGARVFRVSEPVRVSVKDPALCEGAAK